LAAGRQTGSDGRMEDRWACTQDDCGARPTTSIDNLLPASLPRSVSAASWAAPWKKMGPGASAERVSGGALGLLVGYDRVDLKPSRRCGRAAAPVVAVFLLRHKRLLRCHT